MKKKTDEKELLKRFNRTSKLLAVCCVLLLAMGCFVNCYIMFANQTEASFNFMVTILMSLVFTFMGSFGLGYYFSFKVLQNNGQESK